MRAAGDQLASDLQLDERKVVELRERQPFVAYVLDRDGDVAKPQLLGDGFQQPQLGNGRRGVDLDDESLEGPLIGQLPAQRCDRHRIPKAGIGSSTAISTAPVWAWKLRQSS